MPQRLVWVVFVVGCSSDRTSSLSPTKRTTDLSINETAQYCQDLSTLRSRRLGGEAKKLDCAVKARAAVTCKPAFDDCMREEAAADKPMDCVELKPMLECPELTVGDLDACLEDQFSRQKELASADPCSPTDLGSSALCQAIEMRCGQLPSLRSSLAEETVATLDRFSKQMCDCKDKPCADKTNEELTKWGTELAKRSSSRRDERPKEELAKRSAEIMTRYTECMTKLMMAGAQ